MKWNKYTIETTTAAEDYMSAMLADLGIEGVEIKDNIPLSKEDQVVRSRGKISDYAEKMLIFHFLRPGKSYLVNSMWIQNFNLKEITVKTGQHIPVSRDKKEEVKKQYFGYMRSRIYEMD